MDLKDTIKQINQTNGCTEEQRHGSGFKDVYGFAEDMASNRKNTPVIQRSLIPKRRNPKTSRSCIELTMELKQTRDFKSAEWLKLAGETSYKWGANHTTNNTFGYFTVSYGSSSPLKPPTTVFTA